MKIETLFRGLEAEQDFSKATKVSDLSNFKVTHNVVSNEENLIALVYSTLERTPKGVRVEIEWTRKHFYFIADENMSKNAFWNELEKFVENLCREHVIY